MHVCLEHVGGHSRAVNEGVAIAGSNACRREREIVGERSHDQVVVMNSDQRLVVGSSLVQSSRKRNYNKIY